jgi:hypothetical protein
VALAGGSTPLGGSYTGFGRAPSPNESGEVAFFATMSGSSAGVCASYSAPCAVFLRDSDGAISKTLAGGDSGPAGVGGTIGDLATAPFMNDSRQVSVWAGISNGFGSPPATQALVRYTPGEALANVAAVGNVIPLPIDSTFDTFTDASLFPTSPIPNNLGQVAFWGHGSEGIFLTDPPPPGPVITQGPVEGATAPGTSGGEFGNTFDLDIDNNGEAVFANTVTGSASGVTSGIFAFFAGTAVRDVALEGDSAPEGGQFDNFFPPYSNDNGTIVARATTVSPAGEGLYAFFAGSPDAVAVSGDTIPAGQGGGTLTSFSDPSINNSGYVAARGTLTSGQGLYIFFAGSPGSPDSPVKVFKSGEAAPGGGGNFSTFGRPALSDFNDVAVKATLSGGGQGLYAFFAGVPQKLARTNDTADANNRVFTDFGDPVLNIDRAVVFTATFTESGGPSQMGLFAFFAGSPTAQLIADTDLGSPAPSVPPSIGGQFTEFFSPAVTDGTSPVAVARATITGGSASEGLFVFFAGSVVKLVGQGDMITDTTSDTDDAFGPPTPVFPYHAINNGRKVVFVANVVNSATTQGVYFASLDYDNDGVLDFLDNCPSTFNTVQHDTDEDGPGNPCDNCPSAGNTSQQNSDADSFGNVCDNCPTVTNQNQANLDGDPLGDVCDLDDDADKVFDADEGPCGGDSLNAAKQPERLDTPGDDDLDGLFNEGLPSPASDGFDCDGDGWKGNQENLIFSAGTTANDQDPCGNTGWGSDLVGNNILNIADIGSFLTPARSNDGHGTFNKFGHPLDDTAPPGIDAVMARWNLSLPPHDPATQINIADLNALIAGAAGSPARPPMFNGQIAFFTSGGMCPYPQ